MQRFILVLAVLFLSLGGVASAAPADKVTICHATSSESNPWVRIVVSENAIFAHFENPGTPKAGHEDDVLLQGEVDCPAPETPPEVPPTTPPTTPPEIPKTITNTQTTTESLDNLKPFEGK